MKREYKFKTLTSYSFLGLGLLMVVVAVISYFFKPFGIDISFWLLIISILFIVYSMFRILSFYVYLGEYALSVNSNILTPKTIIPWREISDIELQSNGVIIVYRTGGRTKTVDVSKQRFEKGDWETFIDQIIDQWKKGTEST